MKITVQRFSAHVIIAQLLITAHQNWRHIFSLALCSIKIDYRQQASHRAAAKKWGISYVLPRTKTHTHTYTLIDRFPKQFELKLN